MNEFIEKLIEKIVNTPTECLDTFSVSSVVNGIEYGCASRQNEIIDMINELAEEYNGGWIPCSERLPENMQTVIFSTEEGMVESGWYDADKNWCVNDSYFPNAFRFVAWQPLPKTYVPPAAVEEEKDI